jgi:hypothetical protein
MWRPLRIAATVGPVALLLAVGASAIAGSATSDRRPCPTHGSFSRNLIAVVAVSPRVVVETLAFHPYQPYTPFSFACYPPTRRRTFLRDGPIVLGNGVSRPRDHYAGHSLALAGTFAAWVWIGSEGDNAYTGIDLVDGRTGAQATVALVHVGSSYYQPVVRIVLKPHGTLAWSQAHEILVCRRACITEDARLPAGQHVQTRAHSQGIDARSLRATPRGIEWRENGRWRRAPL